MTEADSCLEQLIVLNYRAKSHSGSASCPSPSGWSVCPERVLCLYYLNVEANLGKIVFN